MNAPLLIGITPLEQPDVNLALSLSIAKAFPVLHLGRDQQTAAAALAELSGKCSGEFGVCYVSGTSPEIELPAQVTMAVLPFGMKIRADEKLKLYYQVHSLEEALQAKSAGAYALIIKGNEGAGKVGYESSYVLFQRVISAVKDIDIYVQGGAGVHTAAALIALGAKGIVMDSQLILFPECGLPAALKDMAHKLSGNETRLFGNFRVLVRPNSPVLPDHADVQDLEGYFNDINPENNYLPMGQDIAISTDLVKRYQKLPALISGMHHAIHGHLKQAKALNSLRPGNALAEDLGITYPIAQGPMTRVSDVAPFAEAVAAEGALPFIALSLLKGTPAQELISETKALAGDRSWGIGILGFAPQELRDEQMEYIKAAMPPVVLIAGGRPSQAKPLEKLGIKTFLHVPSVALLDMFLKEGARRFVFEGRECGGHVGPLSSMVLWEKQIERLLEEEHPEDISVFFAGGIHDALSAAFIAVMIAPLAARGIKAGVLMGTSYLYTREAVSTGAIKPGFQQQAVFAAETVLLETAPGHETRCLNSAFTAFFNAEKEKLAQQGTDKKEIWAKLETLNVGRLRIAAKGIEREGSHLRNIDEKQQLELGMYMIGQVAVMRDEVVSIAELHRDVAEGNYRHIELASLHQVPEAKDKALNVAIVGMACIFPGAKDLEEYWRNIVLGVDAVTEVPDERWNKDLYYRDGAAEEEMSHSKWGGFIPAIDFDPLEFGIPPKSLAAIEPTQLLSLMVARKALEDAGYADGNYNTENVSVIFGAEGGNDLANSYSYRCYTKQVFGELPPELDAALPRMTEDSFPGILANVISGRITNRLNLGGRNFTVDAACASSLAAADLACQELYLGKSDMVLAGGADLHNGINDYLMFSSTHALSRKGRCATFDADADGIALGEGIAVLVLKRHEDALRDGDRVYAVIQGIGGSSDGKSLGLTAPRKSGQLKSLERAYAQAGISPAETGLIEAHGTGTVVGDRTELSALTELFSQSGAIPAQTHLGSVKTQIGHTKCAAGLAGLIKAALSVYHGVKPPTIHLKVPNDYYQSANSPFAFHTAAGLWMEPQRRAGISAFGFGGTNFHAVIEGNNPVPAQYPVLRSWPSELFVFRGNTYEQARQSLIAVKILLDENDSIALRDIAFSLATGTKAVQLSIVADRAEDLSMKIDLVLSGVESKDTYITKRKEGKVAFLFPGQGSQRINMARDLFVIFPVMRQLLQQYPHYEEIIFPSAVFTEAGLKAQKDRIRDTRMAQPLLGIADLAIAFFLADLGIEPDLLAGHSYGELPALCFAGAFPADQLVPLSEQRANAILEAASPEDAGAMIAIHCSAEETGRLIEGQQDLYIVNYNSPQQTVVAGTTAAIRQLGEQLRTLKISGRTLEVACAFHSPLVARSKALYGKVLEELSFNDLKLPVWSNTSGLPYPVDGQGIKERLADHLVQPVRFTAQVQAMYADGARIFIEVGPGRILSSLVKACIGKDELVLHAEDSGPNKVTHLLCMLAAYMATGRDISLQKLFDGRGCQLLDLNNPSKYKKSAATWIVNGQHATPLTGPLPAYGAAPIISPIKMKTIEKQPNHTAMENHGAEQMMQEYLNGMKMMIQAQRDVMLRFLGQHVTADHQPLSEQNYQPQPMQVAEHAAQAAVAAVLVEAPEMVPTDVKALLLAVVSEKTGYPAEMLGMELDLEADLSIDSIKRMEIIAEMKNRIGFAMPEEGEDDLMEKLTAIKTLDALVNLLQHTETAGIISAAPADEEHLPDEEKVSRFCVQLKAAPLPEKNTAFLRGSRFAITPAAGEQAAAIKSLLEQQGAAAEMISAGQQLNGYDGLIILDLAPAPAAHALTADAELLKKMNMEELKWVCYLSDAVSRVDQENSSLRNFRGHQGFFRSLAKEYENITFRTISFSRPLSPDATAAITLKELFHQDQPVEIIYQDQTRHRMDIVASAIPAGTEALALDKESVVLVLGGAQGITSKLITRMAKDYPCRYILAGRSPDPRLESTNLFAALKTREEIRDFLIREGKLKKPAEIEQEVSRIEKNNQITETVTSLENSGSLVSYISMDLRNQAALSNLIHQLYAEYGRIDGVIHGAGLLEDKLFSSKTTDSFKRVFDTKVNPLQVLAEQMRPETRFMIFFSSIAGMYGNRGQTDYAAANSVMDSYAQALKGKIAGKVISVNWGPWKGAGMVSPALEKEYGRRGISLIPLLQGTEFFLNELKYGNDSQVLIMAGNQW